MHALKTVVLATTLVALAGCSTLDKTAICCDGGYEYRHRNQWDAEKASSDMATKMAALERDRQRLSDELASAHKENAKLNEEVASLRSSADESARVASQSQQRTADLERELAASQVQTAGLAAASGGLAAANQRTASLESELASLKAVSGDKDKLAAELAAAKQRNRELEAQLAAMGSSAGDRDALTADLAALKRRTGELEGQLADRDKELAGLRGDLSSEMAKLKEAQRGLLIALRPQIDKGAIMVDLNNERLLINLASSYLFGSGEDQLKPAGSEALKQVGGILKEFPEYKVAVDGHTDNRPIRSGLKKKYPTNKELSEARAANAALALTEGGLAAAMTHGYADTKPVMPNTTDEGRAKNRRVEVRVTK